MCFGSFSDNQSQIQPFRKTKAQNSTVKDLPISSIIHMAYFYHFACSGGTFLLYIIEISLSSYTISQISSNNRFKTFNDILPFRRMCYKCFLCSRGFQIPKLAKSKLYFVTVDSQSVRNPSECFLIVYISVSKEMNQ